MKLSSKLIGGNQSLFILMAIALGGMAIYSLSQLGHDVLNEASKSIQEQSSNTLVVGARNDAELIQVYMDSAQRDVKKLSESANLLGYLSALRGENEIWNNLAKAEINRIVSGLSENIKAQNLLRSEQAKASLAVARDVLETQGGIHATQTTIKWQAVNQFSQKTTQVTIPQMAIGQDEIPVSKSFKTPFPVVDKVSSLVGGSCTIFQRINKAGDMLRIATSVKNLDGTRALGSYIPAINPNGLPNPVIEKILKGETYSGRAYVVNAWYVTAYEPLFDAQGNVNGILFAGNIEQNNDTMQQLVSKIKIGESGYPFIMDKSGVLVHHPNASLNLL